MSAARNDEGHCAVAHGDDTEMTRPPKSTPAQNVPQQPVEPRLPGRKRFVRLFPERLAFLLAHLSAPQFSAYLRLLGEFCVRDGELTGETKVRAISGLSPKAWLELVELLAALGVAGFEGDRWVDEDQRVNLALQRQAAERQRTRANLRWAKPRAVS